MTPPNSAVGTLRKGAARAAGDAARLERSLLAASPAARSARLAQRRASEVLWHSGARANSAALLPGPVVFARRLRSPEGSFCPAKAGIQVFPSPEPATTLARTLRFDLSTSLDDRMVRSFPSPASISPGVDGTLEAAWIMRAAPEIATTTEGPLAGLRFAVKDNLDVAGLPTIAACSAFGAATRHRSATRPKCWCALAGKTSLNRS